MLRTLQSVEATKKRIEHIQPNVHGVGACCLSDYHCVHVSPDLCRRENGHVFLGVNQTCSSARKLCVAHLTGCCVVESATTRTQRCVDGFTSERACHETLGGQFCGLGETCNAHPTHRRLPTLHSSVHVQGACFQSNALSCFQAFSAVECAYRHGTFCGAETRCEDFVDGC